jgi:hypothetical protein
MRTTLREIATRFPTLENHLPAMKPEALTWPEADNAHVAVWAANLVEVFDNSADFATLSAVRSGGGTGWVTGGSRHALRFLVGVWNGGGHFDVFAAYGVWDSAHRAAFRAWTVDPVGF